MAGPRVDFALAEGVAQLPMAGRMALWAPRAGQDLSVFPRERSDVITGFYPDHVYFSAQGYACARTPTDRYAASYVVVPRARDLARDLIARAVAVTDGPVIIDGEKTNGVERVLKDCRARVAVMGPVSKAHGKVFAFEATPHLAPVFADWQATPATIEGGYQTLPGVFSADGIDPASALLATVLPDTLGGHVADLGGGWGYLTAQIATRTDITRMDLVEADDRALDCARLNIADPRVAFHWDDACDWRAADPVDTVVTNPPFHVGRGADPELGRAFIRAAARILRPTGELWLVANRHLPYEAEMNMHFKTVSEVAGDNRFKVLHAQRPTRARV